MCVIAAHFIGHQDHVQTVLLALRRMTGTHRDEQIAVVNVVVEYGFAKRLGVSLGDNVDSNDTACKQTMKVLHPVVTRKLHDLAVSFMSSLWLQNSSYLAGISLHLRLWWTRSRTRLLLRAKQ